MNDMIKTLGYNKPLRRNVQIRLKTEAIDAVADLVALNISLDELKTRITVTVGCCYTPLDAVSSAR